MEVVVKLNLAILGSIFECQITTARQYTYPCECKFNSLKFKMFHDLNCNIKTHCWIFLSTLSF